MKRGVLAILVFLLMISLVSAGLFDWLKGTGKVPSEAQDVSVQVAGQYLPAIVSPSVASGLSYNPSDFFVVTNIVISVDVTDNDGTQNLVDGTLVVSVTNPSGTTTRTASCSAAGDVGNTRTYSCSVDLLHYDEPGDWDLDMYIEDQEANSDAVNIGNYFTYNLLKSMTDPVLPNELNWPVLNPGDPDVSSIEPTVVVNRGNYDGDILITSYDLWGDVVSTEIIASGVFSVSDTSGQECVSATGVVFGADGTTTNTLINSNPGPNDGSNEANIYYCINLVPNVQSQSYSTTARGQQWVVSY